MARVRNLVLLLATLCCYSSTSHADDNDYGATEELNHEQLVELARRITNEVRLLELELGIQDKNDQNQVDTVKSLSKRQAVHRAGSGVPMNVPAKMSGFPFGKRNAPLVRRSAKAAAGSAKMSGFVFGKRDSELVKRSASAGSKPVKLAGFAFGKRSQLVKRSLDYEAENDEEKRGAMNAFTFGKRLSSDPAGLSAFSFGKRRDPGASLGALTFGKRGMNPSGISAFNFGKRRDPFSTFSFGKRGMESTGLSAFNFGKREYDQSGLSAFSFGKRRWPTNSLSAFDFGKRGMNAFTFGKRKYLDEEDAFGDDNKDEKRAYNAMSGYDFGKRDTDAAEDADETLNHNDETLRTDN